MCTGSVWDGGMVRASVNGGPSDWRAESKGGHSTSRGWRGCRDGTPQGLVDHLGSSQSSGTFECFRPWRESVR